MPDLVTTHLTKRYSVGPNIISDFSYTFSEGAIYSLMGPNGSGKSTLLHLLSAFSYPTKGSVSWGDTDIHKHPRTYLKNTGFVVPALSLPEKLSLEELVEWRLRSIGNEDDSFAKDLYATLDFDERRTQPLSTYSSGMKRKAELITAMCSRPDVLILDEPFETLDDDSRAKLQGLLHELKKKNTLIILATHLHASYEDIVDETLQFPLR